MAFNIETSLQFLVGSRPKHHESTRTNDVKYMPDFGPVPPEKSRDHEKQRFQQILNVICFIEASLHTRRSIQNKN